MKVKRLFFESVKDGIKSIKSEFSMCHALRSALLFNKTSARRCNKHQLFNNLPRVNKA